MGSSAVGWESPAYIRHSPEPPKKNPQRSVAHSASDLLFKVRTALFHGACDDWRDGDATPRLQRVLFPLSRAGPTHRCAIERRRCQHTASHTSRLIASCRSRLIRACSSRFEAQRKVHLQLVCATSRRLLAHSHGRGTSTRHMGVYCWPCEPPHQRFVCFPRSFGYFFPFSSPWPPSTAPGVACCDKKMCREPSFVLLCRQNAGY